MVSTSKNKTYIIEKIWHYDPDLTFKQDDIYAALVRPCDVSYKTYRNFSLGKYTRHKMITHEGCVLSWFPGSVQFTNGKVPKFHNIEEFIVYANVNMCIVPSFENWVVTSAFHNDYTVKTIDLKTHEVLYDSIDRTLKMMSEQDT